MSACAIYWIVQCKHCGQLTRAPRTHSKVCAPLIVAKVRAELAKGGV